MWDHRYFAYGANLSRSGMAQRCPSARVLGPAVLAGHRFEINRYGLATVVPAPRERVHGLLWTLTVRDERQLDRFEGVASGLYRKDQIDLRLGARAATRAMLYRAADSRPGRPRAGYLEAIAEAAAELGFPEDYLQSLRALLER